MVQSHFSGNIKNLQPSKFREQHAEINWYVKQMNMLDDNPVPPESIFAIILHSTNGSDSSKHDDLIIGIPSENNKLFIDYFDLEALLELYPQPTEPKPTKAPNLIKLK